MEQKEKDIDTLARTIYGEARGETREGKIAVAHVILNRYKSRRWFAGKTIADTCIKPYQFSCWNESDPNREKLMKATEGQLGECIDIARGVIDGRIADVTNGSTHYLTEYAWKRTEWAKNEIPEMRIGRHLFFKDIR